MASSQFNIRESMVTLFANTTTPATSASVINIGNPSQYKLLQIVGYIGSSSTYGNRFSVLVSVAGMSESTSYNLCMPGKFDNYILFSWNSSGIVLTYNDIKVTHVYGIR